MNEKFIEENEVTVEVVYNLFKSAFFKVSEINKNNQFSVEFRAIDVFIDIDVQEKMIRFWFANKVDEKTHDEVVTRANLANTRSAFVKFYIDTQDDIYYLVAEYSMSYEMGVIPFQVVNMAKSFENITVNAGRLILGYGDEDES